MTSEPRPAAWAGTQRWGLGLLLVLLLVFFCATPTSGMEGLDITLDGSFEDWGSVAPFLDLNDDGTPEKGDLRSAWFVVGNSGDTLFARLDVDECLKKGQSTAFDILIDTSRDDTYDFRVELEVRGDGSILVAELYQNLPPDDDPGNDTVLPYTGGAATGPVSSNDCDQATEWSIPFADIGNPEIMNLSRFESHPSGSGQAVADIFPNYGGIQGDIPAGTFSHVGPVINEVFLPSTPGAQWIEIYNSSDQVFELYDFTLTDHDAGGNGNVVLPDLLLPPRSYLVVHFATGTEDLDFSDGRGDFFTGDPTAALEPEDQVVLYASSTQDPTTLADLVAWDPDGDRSPDFTADIAHAVQAGLWPTSAAVASASLAASQTLGRSADSGRRRLPSDWETSGGRDASDPTPGEMNLGGVVLNEVLPDPISGTDPGLELYNAGTGEVNLTGWMVSDVDPDTGGDGFTYSIPQVGGMDLLLPAGSRIWIALGMGADSTTLLHANLSPSNPLDPDADQVALFFRNQISSERIVDFVSWDVSSFHDADWSDDDDPADAARIWNLAVLEDYVGVSAMPTAHSLVRGVDGADTNLSEDWVFSLGISDGDRDGDTDGWVDTRDNCPDATNSDQADQDGDGLGDVCDGDIDGDGLVNSQDCSQLDPTVWSLPTEPTNLAFSSSTDFSTDTDPQAAEHHVYRGTRPSGSSFEYNHVCFLTSLVGANFTDVEVPAPGSAYFYLVAASNGCGDAGLGTDSSGSSRPIPIPCP